MSQDTGAILILEQRLFHDRTVEYALDNLPGDGYTVHVLLDEDPNEDPIIFEESKWTIADNSTTIIGEVSGVLKPIIKFLSNTGAQKTVYIQGKTNVTIKNLDFDFENIIQDQSGETYGIWGNDGSDNTTIENCYLYNSKVTPLTFKNCSSCSVYNNIFGPVILDVQSWQRKLANSVSFEADEEDGCSYNEVIGNTFYPNNSHHPINFIHVGAFQNRYSYYNDIDGNRIEGGWSGIFLSNQKDFHVHNNLIYEAKGYKLNDEDPPYIEFFEGRDGHGIQINRTASFTNTWSVGTGAIYNNVFYKNYNTGITIFEETATGIKVFNNIFLNNAVTGTSTNGRHCFNIYYDQNDPAVFKNNLYYNESGYGENSYLRWRYGTTEYDNDPDPAHRIWGSLEDDEIIDDNPNLVAYNFLPGSNSNVIDAGYDVTINYKNTSFNGVTRPQAQGVDIGAYELEPSLELLQLISADLTSPTTLELSFNSDLDTNSITEGNKFYIDSKKIKGVEVINPRKIKVKTTAHQLKKYNIVQVSGLKTINGNGLLKQFCSQSYSSENLPKNISLEEPVSNFNLFQNYPNPFNPETVLNYTIPSLCFVQLKIYDILGREIQVLVNEMQPQGQYTINFNGSSLSTGTYFYSLTAGNYHISKKMILLK